MRTVSLMTANQEFSKLVREVERGEGFLITRRDGPVAKLVPHSAGKADGPEWAPAHLRMVARIGGGPRRERSGSSGAGSMTARGRSSLDTGVPIRPVGRDAGERCRRSAKRTVEAAPRRPDASMNDATPPLTRAARRSQRRGRTG
ncbi:MAG: type II toxin-antitoxin system prevent-host-death family antitoxin [Rhodospirillales bacterium]|nr:type II toxin-antitoxin system prevent-host-death family antitoxin [Rhodospirillales bacterium]